MLGTDGEKLKRIKAELNAEKWRKISIALMVLCAILAISLFSAARSHSAAFEATRQSHMAWMQRSLRGFEAVTFELHHDLDSATEKIRGYNSMLEINLRTLHIHNTGSAVSFQGFNFIRTDAPEILLENSREIFHIMRSLIRSIEPSTDTDYALELILTARDEINHFFTEHDFEMTHRSRVESIRRNIPHITGETLRFSDDASLDALWFILPFMPFDSNIWALLAHHDKDFPEDLAYLMSRMSLVADDIFLRDKDDAREISELIGQKLSQLRENLNPDMDLQTVLDLITDTMREIKEITPLADSR